MKFLPFENITYHTQLPGYEVIKRLSDNLEPRKIFSFGFNRDRKKYEGNIERNKFNINRVIYYKNSFRPTITGKLSEDETGTTIKVKMRLHIFVGIFMTVWLGGVFLGLLAGLTAGDPVFMLVPFIMLLFGYGLTTGAFKYESIRAKKHLAEIFEAEIESTYNRRNSQNKQYKK